MRNFIISTICLIMIIGIWICFYIYSSQKIDYYKSELDVIICEYVNEEKWPDAISSFNEIQCDWNKYKHIAACFLNSSELSHIDNTFKKIRFYIYASDKSNSSGELAYLKSLFKHLHEDESLNLDNVF